ncbi:putative gustatory receptor 93c [Stomoxys calcitrans]|nr:putative gustatory receptor 93c [Stomoxys calcitrans]
MRLENIVLDENVEWERQVELFLYRLNLYDFKLTILNFFDVGNSMSLAFISGIFTAFSIFTPFAIKDYRIQKFLENRNYAVAN